MEVGDEVVRGGGGVGGDKVAGDQGGSDNSSRVVGGICDSGGGMAGVEAPSTTW